MSTQEMTEPLTCDLATVEQHIGEPLGPGPWKTITQEQVNLFADATGDHQWIHVDVERAKAGPFGAPIAHGYLTVSLLVEFTGQLLHVTGGVMGVNYGMDKLRFPSPVPVGSEIRARGEIAEVKEFPGGKQYKLVVTVEVKGQEKPAMVAEPIFRIYAAPGS